MGAYSSSREGWSRNIARADVQTPLTSFYVNLTYLLGFYEVSLWMSESSCRLVSSGLAIKKALS